MDNSHILPLDKHFNQALHSPFLVNGHVQRLASTDGTFLPSLVLEGIRINAVCANEHEVIVQVRCGASGNFESFIATGRCDDIRKLHTPKKMEMAAYQQ